MLLPAMTTCNPQNTECSFWFWGSGFRLCKRRRQTTGCHTQQRCTRKKKSFQDPINRPGRGTLPTRTKVATRFPHMSHQHALRGRL